MTFNFTHVKICHDIVTYQCINIVRREGNMNIYTPATTPTLYFIGVTTSSSSIMQVFPKWANALHLNATIVGFDFIPHAPMDEYRQVVNFIKNDPLSLGALVTTHKIDLYNSCKDLFDYLDPYALQLGEISSISKKDGKLYGHAKDPISSGLALENFVPKNFWSEYDGNVFIMGAGGSALAMSLYFCQDKFGSNVPKHIIIANRSTPRLESAKEKLQGINPQVKFSFIHTPTPKDNDAILASLKPHSLIINATGLGKDGPGSPLTNDCIFPKNSLVWEINYRGELLFMKQAKKQEKDQNLYIEDGWIYFIHGWTQVIGEVFNINFNKEMIEKLSIIAKLK